MDGSVTPTWGPPPAGFANESPPFGGSPGSGSVAPGPSLPWVPLACPLAPLGGVSPRRQPPPGERRAVGSQGPGRQVLGTQPDPQLRPLPPLWVPVPLGPPACHSHRPGRAGQRVSLFLGPHCVCAGGVGTVGTCPGVKVGAALRGFTWVYLFLLAFPLRAFSPPFSVVFYVWAVRHLRGSNIATREDSNIEHSCSCGRPSPCAQVGPCGSAFLCCEVRAPSLLAA